MRSSSDNFANDPPNPKASALAAASEWIKTCWDSDRNLPAFAVDGNKISVLLQPQDFYQTLKTKASQAQRRIVFASLYLGTGKLEKELVDTMYQRTKEMIKTNTDFQIDILLDHPRASRGKKSSKTMLLPLVKDFTDNVNVCMYHPPKLRGLLYKLIPERFNETISAMHIKSYIFDDTLVLSGANLSNDYFTNRQDRCIVFEDSKELCDFFHNLVKTVSSFSLTLQPDCTTKVSANCSEHPYKGSKEQYIEIVKKKLRHFIQEYSQLRTVGCNSDQIFCREKKDLVLDDILSGAGVDRKSQERSSDALRCFPKDKSHESHTQYDTLLIPTLQMFYYGVRQDEFFTSRFLELAPSNSEIFLATAYFNITNQHWNEVLRTKSRNFDVVMAHPLANGFYKAPGPAGGVPFAYTLIAKQCFKDILQFKLQNRIKFWEYQRPGWTFHGKGLWAVLCDAPLPQITMIGSSNFGNRSVYRDLEAQVTIVTTNDRLSRQLKSEKVSFLEYSEKVDTNTYKDPERKVPFWVFLIRTFMRTFF